MRGAALRVRRVLTATRTNAQTQARPGTTRRMSTQSPRTLTIHASSDKTWSVPSYYRATDERPYPPHWRSAHPLSQPGPSGKRGFISPWPSNNVGQNGFVNFFKARMFEWDEKPLPKRGQGLPVVRKATWGRGESSKKEEHNAAQFRYTWLGHAACHLQIPLTSSGTTLKILTDPVFSYRCSPVQFMGPARYTDPPTSVNQMASEEEYDTAWPDVILISHNHYDHLDYETIKAFVQGGGKQRPCPTFVVPLGLKVWFTSNFKSIPSDKIIELDWWNQTELHLGDGAVRITCTPAQHFSGRSAFDRDQTLWASYALHVLRDDNNSPRIWFSGDTGYRSVPRGTVDEEALPACPAFKEIGELLGPFDLALIACGAYLPRSVMSPIHLAPHESVQVHRDVQSRKSFGIHHATFRLTPEDVDEPARLWIEEGRKAGLKDGEVDVLEIGETRVVDVK